MYFLYPKEIHIYYPLSTKRPRPIIGTSDAQIVPSIYTFLTKTTEFLGEEAGPDLE